MKASDAKKLSDLNQINYDMWLEQSLKKIENASKNGEYQVWIYVGNGSYHNEDFKNELREKEKLIKNLGYKTRSETQSSWGSVFYSTFDYFLEVNWD